MSEKADLMPFLHMSLQCTSQCYNKLDSTFSINMINIYQTSVTGNLILPIIISQYKQCFELLEYNNTSNNKISTKHQKV